MDMKMCTKGKGEGGGKGVDVVERGQGGTDRENGMDMRKEAGRDVGRSADRDAGRQEGRKGKGKGERIRVGTRRVAGRK